MKDKSALGSWTKADALPSSDSLEKAVYRALVQVEHPELAGHNLVELGMIPNVRAETERLYVTLALPSPEAPIKDELVHRIREAVRPLATEAGCEIVTDEMDEERRAAFLDAAGRIRQDSSPSNQVGQVLAVMSGKGGVGKSSVTGLLASALRRRHLKVGILDADITGPSIPMLFGVDRQPQGSQEGIVPPETAAGIKVISANLLVESENEPLIWRGPMVSKAIQQFWTDVVWGELDYLLVDLPPGTSDAALTVMQSLPVDGTILVTSPQDLAGMVVRKAAGMISRLDVPLLGLVENMSFVECPVCGAQMEPFGPSRAERTASHARTSLLGRLALDPRLAMLCDGGRIEEYSSADFDGVVEKVLDISRERAVETTTGCA